MIKVTPQLIEQTRRWLTRTIWFFSHGGMSRLSGREFEQWHEDKAKELLAFLNMSESERARATKELHVGSVDPERLKLFDKKEKQ